MDECVRHFKKATGVSLVKAIECATLHPAQTLNIQKQKGTLDYSSDADFVLLDDTGPLKILHTFISGHCVYSNPSGPPVTYKARS